MVAKINYEVHTKCSKTISSKVTSMSVRLHKRLIRIRHYLHDLNSSKCESVIKNPNFLRSKNDCSKYKISRREARDKWQMDRETLHRNTTKLIMAMDPAVCILRKHSIWQTGRFSCPARDPTESWRDMAKGRWFLV